jgi:CheY-like chemotaxis protein
MKKVLIVDDDRILRRLIKKKFERFENKYFVVLAENGLDATRKLKENVISLVVTDMQMPEMDGFALLAHLSKNYPDIPAIILTAYGNPALEKAALEGGAISYIEKPFVVEDLALKIEKSLDKQSEGGVLQTVPLDMFVQLIEMELKTTTLRVVNKESNKNGVLFFSKGELFDARIGNVHGEKAAYEIFSWEKVTLSIQDVCAVKEKKIKGDLQAILFDAMRLKDESADSADQPMGPSDPPEPDTTPPPQMAQEPSITENIRKKLEKASRGRDGLEDIYEDHRWDHLVDKAKQLGGMCQAGNLKSCYVDDGRLNKFILLSGNTTTVISVKPDCPRDIIMKILYE